MTMASRRGEKDRRKKDRLPRRLFKQPRGPKIPPGSKVVYEPAGRERMSDVLDEFIEPYSDAADTDEAYENLLRLGMLAWNAALLPADRRQAMIDETLEAGFSTASRSVQALAREVVETLVRRKLEHFAENQRAILSFKLSHTRDGLHLSVASTL